MTKMVTIEEMIPAAALKRCMALIEAGKRTKPDLLPILEEYRAELEANGVDPAYAAYALEYALMVTSQEPG
jgi:hypothetical protein